MKIHKCEHCRYAWYPDDRAPLMCRHKDVKHLCIIPYCSDLNYNDTCEAYRRKWWKFWAGR